MNLFMLAHGVDFRREFKKNPGESEGSFARRVHARFFDGDRSPDGRELDAKKALEILPQCFDFGGQRKNAFRRMFNDREVEYDESFFASLDIQGKKKEAIRKIAERRNVDERAAG